MEAPLSITDTQRQEKSETTKKILFITDSFINGSKEGSQLY